jgi:mersacidin/lichenicidin family type 2 lantibiotic
MKIDIVRAWKDAHYREHLSVEEQALLPENPAGSLELTDEDLAGIQGVHGAYCQIVTAVEVCAQTTTIGKCNTIGHDCRFNF